MVVNDIVFIDGMMIIALDEDTRDGFAGHRLDNEVNQETDLIKLWDGVASL